VLTMHLHPKHSASPAEPGECPCWVRLLTSPAQQLTPYSNAAGLQTVSCTVQDLCEILTALQQDAPQHSYEETRVQIERSFGLPIEAIFDSFKQQPLASASIAQVRICIIMHGAAVQCTVVRYVVLHYR
jgi:ABC1 atypical kinase-like domain